jgi:hypothetical protein
VAASKKGPAKKAAPRKRPAPKAAGKKAAKPPASVKSGAKPRGPAERVVKTRVVFPMPYYEEHKDEIKAPFKAHGMKWTFLGEGKGLYKREKEIHCFVQFKDDGVQREGPASGSEREGPAGQAAARGRGGVHYSIWGDDKKGVSEILAAWRALAGETLWSQLTSAGETAAKAEEQEKESEAVRLWKLGEPQPRPGEPELFFKKRREEWLAKKPA